MNEKTMLAVTILITTFLLSTTVNAEFWRTRPVLLWTYYSSPLCNDGRNDCPNVTKTIEAIDDIGADAMVMGLKTNTSYSKLVEFLNASKGSGIGVWAVMHHNCDVEPHPYDCVAWARELANLSINYPQLQAMVLDDLHPNGNDDVTPEFIRNIINAKNKINPDFKFVPTLYYDAGDELQFFRDGNPYDGVFEDGATFWYWSSYGNNGEEINITQLREFVNEADYEVHPTPFMTGVYCMRYGTFYKTYNISDIIPEPEKVREMIFVAKSKSDAIALYGIPLFIYDINSLFNATIFRQQENTDPAYDYMLTSSGKGTFHTWYQAIKTNISGPGTVRVRFDIRDSRNFCSYPGYQFKQLLINGKVIWESDVCEDDNNRQTIDKEIYSDASMINITIRQYSKKGNWLYVSTYINTPEVYLNNNPVSTEWKFDSNISMLNELIKVYNTVKEALKPTCGNNVTEQGEACDGYDMKGYNCTTVAAGFVGGNLSCFSDCSAYNVSQCLPGTVVIANNCSLEAVQDAVNRASDGDSVLVPKGNCIWNKTLQIGRVRSWSPLKFESKNLILKGAGIDKTNITITKNTNVHIYVQCEEGKPFRITGFTFKGMRRGSSTWPAISMRGHCENWRIDHNRFDARGFEPWTQGSGIGVTSQTGVIDHCIFSNTYTGVYVRGYGDFSWESPQTLGTANAVYIEDCQFAYSPEYGGDGANDAYGGARYVFRYNNVTNGRIGHHGLDSGGYRSPHTFEIYGNTQIMEKDNWWYGFRSRGGTGVIFNNTLLGNYKGGITFGVVNYRTCCCTENDYQNGNCDCPNPPCHSNCGFWGRCDSHPDYFCSSTWKRCSTTQECPEGETCTRIMDGHLNSSTGYPCRDQTGRTTDEDGDGIQDISPLFEWENTVNGEDADITVNDPWGCSNPSMSDHIREGRDFYNDAVRYDYGMGLYTAHYTDDYGNRRIWRYKPYVYPHPVALIYADSHMCIHKAEIYPCNGKIETKELLMFIRKWLNNNAEMSDLISAIRLWKSV